MISPRFLSREEWESELRHYGCYPMEGGTDLNTAEFWRYPWGGYPFTVPREDDGRMMQSDLQTLVAAIAASAPDDWTFPDP